MKQYREIKEYILDLLLFLGLIAVILLIASYYDTTIVRTR